MVPTRFVKLVKWLSGSSTMGSVEQIYANIIINLMFFNVLGAHRVHALTYYANKSRGAAGSEDIIISKWRKKEKKPYTWFNGTTFFLLGGACPLRLLNNR